jgi:hypothetical protein
MARQLHRSDRYIYGDAHLRSPSRHAIPPGIPLNIPGVPILDRSSSKVASVPVSTSPRAGEIAKTIKANRAAKIAHSAPMTLEQAIQAQRAGAAARGKFPSVERHQPPKSPKPPTGYVKTPSAQGSPPKSPAQVFHGTLSMPEKPDEHPMLPQKRFPGSINVEHPEGGEQKIRQRAISPMPMRSSMPRLEQASPAQMEKTYGKPPGTPAGQTSGATMA